jgi:hypothetical protein
MILHLRFEDKQKYMAEKKARGQTLNILIWTKFTLIFLVKHSGTCSLGDVALQGNLVPFSLVEVVPKGNLLLFSLEC